jgi:copper chaperone
MVSKIYVVPEISCEHCVRAITQELSSIKGVEVESVDIATKQVLLKHDESVTEDEILTSFEDAGYAVAASSEF